MCSQNGGFWPQKGASRRWRPQGEARGGCAECGVPGLLLGLPPGLTPGVVFITPPGLATPPKFIIPPGFITHRGFITHILWKYP